MHSRSKKRPPRRRPANATIISIISLMLSLFAIVGGAAYATGVINGHQIKNGTISLAKFTQGAKEKTLNSPGQPGADGKEGPAGKNGSNGSNGTDGKAGEKGDTGNTGSQGPKGDKGEKGDTGSQGTVGATGPTGPQGPAGPTGPQGPGGPQGNPGATGPTGPQGPQGESGLNSGEPRIVTQSNLQGWKLATYGDNSKTPEPGYPEGRGSEPENVENGTLEFSTPPSPPSLGTQSLKMTTTAGHPVVAYLPLPAGNPPLLSELTSAGYDSLVVSSESEFNDVALQFEVVHSSATHFASGYTTVVYEPYQNGENTVVGEEHHHVVAAGNRSSALVWSTQALPGGECSQNNPCELSQFDEENPQALMLDAKLRIGQNTGTGWPGFEAYVDDVRLGFGEYNRYDLGG